MANRLSLIKSINALGRKSKDAVKVLVPKKQPKLAIDGIGVIPHKQLNATEEWQINWMNEYAAAREEAEKRLASHKSLNAKQLVKIGKLRGKVNKRNELLKRMAECLNKKNARINKYKTRCITAQHKLKFLQPLLLDSATNTEPLFNEMPSLFVDAATNTEPLLDKMPSLFVDVASNVEPLPDKMPCQHKADVSDDKVEQTAPLHSTVSKKKAQTKKGADEMQSYKFKCPDCQYGTNKKNTFDVHRAEFCINPPVKDRECKICGKFFTRRALRVHLDQYTKTKHKATGKHKDVSLSDHQAYLDEIKAEINKD